MDSNVDESITKIYEKQQTMSGSEEEAMEFIQVLQNHQELNINLENNDTPIKLPKKSWNKIIKMIPEEENYSLAYICFSLVNEVEENEIWGIRKNGESDEAEVFQDVFFNTVLEASVPHEIPFAMCEEDFSQFTDYFNQKEANDRNIQLSNEEWIKENIKEKENIKNKEKEDTEAKEDENNKLTEVKQIIEDKNGVKKIITTKTVTQSQTVYKKKIQPTTKEKDKEKITNINIPPDMKDKDKIKEIKEKPIIPKEVRQKIFVKDDKEQKEGKQEISPKEEEVIYRIVKQGRFKPKMKVIKKSKDPRTGKEIENEITNGETIYNTGENKPNIKISRKKIILKNGKEQEVEEEPKSKAIYEVIKFNKDNEPLQTKIIRKYPMDKYGRQKEEDILGDEVIVKTIKQGPNKDLKKIIIKKDGKVLEIEEEVPLTVSEIEKKGEQPDNLIIKKKIIPKDIGQQETKEEKVTKPIKEEEPQSKFIRRRIIQKESKPEEVCEDEIYKIVNIGRKYNPKTKVVKNLKGKEEDILEDKIIYEKKEEPQIKRIRKRVIIKNGKEEEVEEDPGKNVIYKVVKYGKENDPQTKIKRIKK